MDYLDQNGGLGLTGEQTEKVWKNYCHFVYFNAERRLTVRCFWNFPHGLIS